MDNTALTTLFNIFSLPFLLLLLLTLIFIILINHKILTHSSSKRFTPLPPGPKPWPIIGNILHLGKKPHASLAHFAKLHGPLISLRLGSRLLVVASSPTSAAEILKTHDRLFSARTIPAAFPYGDGYLDRVAIVWNPSCSDHWKLLRAMCRTELFSAKAVESQASLREKKVSEMMDFLSKKQGEVVNIGEIVFTTAFNTISNLLFSKDLLSYEDHQGIASGLKNLITTTMELSTAPNIADFYPIFTRLDPQGIKTKMANRLEKMFCVWENDIKKRRQTNKDSPQKDFLDIFLSKGFDDHQINWLVLELFAAGVDTTTTVVEWAMTELLKERAILQNVAEEVDTEIQRSNIKESDISKLEYVNACVKETLRLHPPAPFLIPRRAAETCEVMGYIIPKDSQVLVNVWAIGRDPSVWKDPLRFKPERFVLPNVEFKGHDFQLLPFGSGRRVCPGLAVASRQLVLILASLIHGFDWSVHSSLDMNDRFGITLTKDSPLLVVPKLKRKS
ncbi:probable (S)-N-methylcoclaurine 3'-hydroxylase isozyme 2 [Mercurialis annua]|uniref:probable (S)-N-methylcoclaurine 3'-hydroxylase isozyme 2 n=1 Tax=Mercurialis annua TaxID=3986 RepID=UPI0021606B98|nr:probable (S)-N-methylcoclaurine 3'-hydroxylase isozyme 2 [Mercurialis annua]